ncbi:DUF58 domain-containing protein [Salinisphaera aquimarina]|uniref:DUF58 domain-containing protein n=1 Tax=Salinisphaera aquimarina TaxID=2094031 RepID=A0ABV7EQW6_9GAMM
MRAALDTRLRRARQRFIERRLPPAALPLSVSRRRLYILPTRSGGLFAVLLIVMLLGATNYSNSLGFALTFWLAAIALVSMHHAHRNLLGLEIQAVHARPVFAGESVRFQITLAHQARRARRSVRLCTDAQPANPRVDIASSATVTVTVAAPAKVRGPLPCPRLRIESTYPIGLFRSWSWLAPRAEVLVYPRCVGRERLPVPAGGAENADSRHVRGHDEFIGHRPYVRGDSPRHIDWKASARSDDLLVREYADRVADILWLDYDRLGAMEREARLSQLALWVMQAERQGRVYGLRLPNTQLGPDVGRSHRLACLRALALA